MDFVTAAIIVLTVCAAVPLVLAWFWPGPMRWVGLAAGALAVVLIAIEVQRPAREPASLAAFPVHRDGNEVFDLGLDLWLYAGLLAVAALTVLIAVLRRRFVTARLPSAATP